MLKGGVVESSQRGRRGGAGREVDRAGGAGRAVAVDRAEGRSASRARHGHKALDKPFYHWRVRCNYSPNYSPTPHVRVDRP
eukprot:1183399-Prorocentrum_minimum.AAC.3